MLLITRRSTCLLPLLLGCVGTQFNVRAEVIVYQGKATFLASTGVLHAYDDSCSSGNLPWQSNLEGRNAGSNPAILDGYLYVQSLTGKVGQVRASDGVGMSYATVTSTSGHDDHIFYERADTRLPASVGGVVKKLCIPWDSSATDKARLKSNEKPLPRQDEVARCAEACGPTETRAPARQVGVMDMASAAPYLRIGRYRASKRRTV